MVGHYVTTTDCTVRDSQVASVMVTWPPSRYLSGTGVGLGGINSDPPADNPGYSQSSGQWVTVGLRHSVVVVPAEREVVRG
ncbi:hypothetical protein Pmani_013661 [Petrolisthes manimaculis]|uniref:Uncharacterized protein n=1 Tax=Petrolisthes manimaculis TaxID=1843537 RepID=A0AAE1PVI0_9EUCA|nr:hypothetical protein Pmani_013661 [Petrolisthes manimaculis]